MWLFVMVVFVLAATSCQANHECHKPKDISKNFTSVFDIGNENWSFKDCGVWSNTEVAAPWRVAVSRTDGATCFGILLSNFDFVTSECKEVADDFRKEPSGVKAYTDSCYDQKVKSTDAPSAECTGLEVKGVAAVGKDSDETQLHLWRLVDQINDTNPVCLFNLNQKQKGGYGDANDYQVFDRKWKGHVEASVGGAPNSSQTSALCVKIGRNHNNADKNDFSGDFLVKEVRGRMTLRGFFFWPVAEHKIFVYTDVVPFIKQLVTKSHNMYIMPQVPPPKTKTDFSKAPKLNIQSECGMAAAVTIISGKHARPIRDIVNTPVDYITYGTKSAKGAYPWHASLSYRPKDSRLDSEYEYCGATLISDRVVVTAAHCLFLKGKEAEVSDLQIALGMHNASEISGTEQYIKLEKVALHPKYNRNEKLYDVALLFLEEEVNVTAHVSPICLWDDDYSMDVLRGRIGTVVGWGTTENEDTTTKQRKPSDILLEGHLSVLDHKECYVQEKVFYRKYLHPGVNFCASGAQNKNVAACRGDSGGGFIIPKDGKWYLRGVVSFGVNKKINDEVVTCNEDYPSLYVDLGSCMDWIVQQVALA